MLKLIALTTLVLTFAAPIARADSGEGNRAENRGRAVSDCNQRANVQDLKGQERKDFVEWCTGRDNAANDEIWERYSECYARMTDQGLSDADRRQYVRNCAGQTAFNMRRW
jgi:hypothetical protein